MNTQIADEQLEMIVFEVGNLLCGLPMREIQEIINLPNITKVRMPQADIEGLINLRGKIVTVINMNIRCGFAPLEARSDMRIIAVEFKDELLGLLVEKVVDSVQASADDIIPVPGNMDGIQAQIFKAMYKKEDKLIGILDIEKALFGEAA